MVRRPHMSSVQGLKFNKSEFTYDKNSDCWYFYTGTSGDLEGKFEKTDEVQCIIDMDKNGVLLGVELVIPPCKAKKSWS